MAKIQYDWVNALLSSKFFDNCDDHPELRKNEKNQFCLDCNICFCKHCINDCSTDSNGCTHDRLLIIRRYVYNDVVRLLDIQEYLDCTDIQIYKTNGIEAVHLNPRNENSKGKCGSIRCEACGTPSNTRFCSIACKVSIDNKIEINMSTQKFEVDHVPSMEAEENSSGNAYRSSQIQSLTASLSEVIQWRPRKQSNPRRAPLF